MGKRNIVQSDEDQNAIFTQLIDQMVEQGKVITTPQVPGQVGMSGTTEPQPKGPTNNDGSVGETGSTAAKQSQAAQAMVPNQAKIDPNQTLTTSVANQGQLIPMPVPTIAGGSSPSSDLAEVKRLIGQVAGNQTNPAEGADSGSDGGSDGGIMNTIGSIAEAATSFLAWIICTELMRQGKMPRKWWIKGAPVFASYPEFVRNGYYLWAIPCVAHLRQHPGSYFSSFLCFVFNVRAYSIAEKRTLQGSLVTAILWPVCWVLGAGLWLFGKQPDWTSVYKVKN